MNEEQRLTVIPSDGALGIDLRTLSVINDLTERLKGITAEQIAAFGRRLNPRPRKRSTFVGSVDEIGTRALYALWRSLDCESDIEQAKAAMAVHEQVETDLSERHALLASLACVAREMFWSQVKLDLGIHKCVGIGIFADWSIVEQKNSGPSISGFMQMLGGVPTGGDGE